MKLVGQSMAHDGKIQILAQGVIQPMLLEHERNGKGLNIAVFAVTVK